jgi:hypothetical protein
MWWHCVVLEKIPCFFSRGSSSIESCYLSGTSDKYQQLYVVSTWMVQSAIIRPYWNINWESVRTNRYLTCEAAWNHSGNIFSWICHQCSHLLKYTHRKEFFVCTAYNVSNSTVVGVGSVIYKHLYSKLSSKLPPTLWQTGFENILCNDFVLQSGDETWNTHSFLCLLLDQLSY